MPIVKLPHHRIGWVARLRLSICRPRCPGRPNGHSCYLDDLLLLGSAREKYLLLSYAKKDSTTGGKMSRYTGGGHHEFCNLIQPV